MKVVFTNHARERMEQRIISEELVLETVQTPDRTYLEADGDTKFIRRVYRGNIHVVCKPLPDENKWLVKSVWFRPTNAFQRPTYRARTVPRRSQAAPREWSTALLFLILVILVLVLYFLVTR